MRFLDDLKNTTLLLVPSIVKSKILDYMEKNNLFFPFKLMTLEEVRNSLTFSYDENAICYLQKKYKSKKGIVQIYLDNLYYVTDSYNENMNLLRQIKEDLEEQHLLYKKENFSSYLKNCDVIVYGYTILSKQEQYWIEKIKKYTTVQFITEETYPLEQAYLYFDIEEELKAVFEEIASLLKKGIALSHIYLTNVSHSMYPKIQRIARNYHIPLEAEQKFLYTTPLYQKMKQMILHGEEIQSLPYMEELLAKVNRIQKLEEYNLEDILDSAAQEINIQEEQTTCLSISPLLNNVYSEEDYVFILNANASILPTTYKDEDFLYDAIKPDILETTTEKNKLSYERYKKAIAQIKNKKVFLIEEEEGTIYYPSPLLDDVPLYKQEKNFISHASHKQNRRNLTLLLDERRKYGTTFSSLERLKQNYPLNYCSYHATFTGIHPEKLKMYLEGKLQLSYSSLHSFYTCSFQYYLEYILRLSSHQETFSMFLGTLFHLLLKEKPKDTASFISSYLEQEKKNLSKKESFYLQWNLKDIEDVLAFWEDFAKHSSFTVEEKEKKITLTFPSQYTTTFVGIIDKKWKNEKENTCILVDYKTGNTSFDLRDTIYGLGMQLPIYYYLVKNENKKEKVIGFYLQPILEKNFKYKKGKTIKQQKRESLKLNGYTLAQENILPTVDTTYKDSQFIKGLKMGNNGFYAYSKVLRQSEMEALYHLVEEKIENMLSKIESASFPINPKKIRGENRSCKFCPYRSICFRKEEDIEEMEEIKDFHFLGGDANA